MELTCREIENILDMKYIDASTTGYTIPPGVYEFKDNNLMSKSLLPDDVKANFTIDQIRVKSNLRDKKTIRFTKTSFFSYYIGFYSITFRTRK